MKPKRINAKYYFMINKISNRTIRRVSKGLHDKIYNITRKTNSVFNPISDS